MLNKMRVLIKEEQGQGLSEYGLVLAGVVVVVAAAVILLQAEITTLFTNILP
ncbi:Flp family type IVb pilin [Litchfieldia salsa]|uniref:Pilus assembly protein Flp/PilA n=1 Tax=Litchfieldia salsa TaxID=930152 RepID=A0A1H0UBZ3_9BACI|nr:Flp family type IVb pilin [Litchfieldia salsa]SDP63822.1 pilus assembly protein Flp/PilA [Litchfieldia salsa]